MVKQFDFRNVTPAQPKRFDPTPEQIAILQAFAKRHNLKIQAGAGTGKTTTLRLIAESAPTLRGVYIAYNRAIADEAKRTFPRNIVCKTAHGFAYAAVGYKYSARLNSPRLPSAVLVRKLKIDAPFELTTTAGEPAQLKEWQLARLVMETISHFCYSDERSIQRVHVPHVPGMTDEDRKRFVAFILPKAERAWDDLQGFEGELKFEHDHYLKIWQLGNPTLKADFVMLDEAQDANPVIASIVSEQRCQKILVGDSCQAIYGWRGAVDAMQSFDGKELFLSQSFRFGPEVAAEANKFLALLNAPLRIEGKGAASRVEPLSEPRAILCRTNAAAIIEAMSQIAQSRRVAIVGGGEAMRRLASAALSLQAGEGTDHPELCLFTNWQELKDYVEDNKGAGDLKVLVKIIDTHGAAAIIDACDSLSDESSADVIISTAHKSKGLEWDTVQISADFDRSKSDKRELPERAELMLAYVAVTRARKVLDNFGLAWVNDF